MSAQPGEPFGVALDRMLGEAYERMMAQAATGEGLTAESIRSASDQLGESPVHPTITVHKVQAFLPFSAEVYHPDCVALTPVPWYRRARWRWQAWRERAGRKIGSLIAGVDLFEREEDW